MVYLDSVWFVGSASLFWKATQCHRLEHWMYSGRWAAEWNVNALFRLRFSSKCSNRLAEFGCVVLSLKTRASLAKQLTSSFAEAGYAVDHAADGERADFSGANGAIRRDVLDLGLPKIDGLTLLRNWREAGLATPVCSCWTARGSWHEQSAGIDGGADDYVSKPFRIEEVLARFACTDTTSKWPPYAGAFARAASPWIRSNRVSRWTARR